MLNFKKVSIFAFALLAVLALSLSSFTLPSAEEKVEVENYDYHFIYASCFCDPSGGSNQDKHYFVSPVLSGDRDADEERFDAYIKRNYEAYFRIDGGTAMYYKTQSEASEARQKYIDDKKASDYQIHYVNF